METKILLIATIAVIGIIIIGGCIGEEESKPEPTPTLPPSEPEVKELSLTEIVDKTKRAIDDVSTYEFESKQTITKSGKPEKEIITSKVDRASKKKYESNVEIMFEESIETITYVIGGTAYTNPEETVWLKSGTEWNGEDILVSIKNLLSKASSKEVTKIDGTDAYVLQIDADKSIFEGKFMEVGKTDVEEMINNAKDIEIRLWIAKDTFLPLKESRAVSTKLKGESVKLIIETTFENYNKPQDIQLPKEAESAEDVMAEEEPIENPEQVGKTMDAIDNVTSYQLDIERNINKASNIEKETNEIVCDRANEKLRDINTFTIEGVEIFALTYVSDGTNYVMDSYSEEWSKFEMEWGKEDDFLIVIKNLLKKTKVEVSEENNTWVFDVKANKDVFSGEFIELASGAKTEGKDPEVISDELNANAKNIVVKIWVTKDTFLPVKEVMSVESRYGGLKMIMDKELNFNDYNVPVAIKVPIDARRAEKIE